MGDVYTNGWNSDSTKQSRNFILWTKNREKREQHSKFTFTLGGARMTVFMMKDVGVIDQGRKRSVQRFLT